ncbi:MAG: hypothetical protein ACP5RH_21415, partial [Leptodesmis sp.]|uniref:hypothetical protein n=1 Tax=Leptodesmis sp. TaxID=3100501 RepID=UPI003D132869
MWLRILTALALLALFFYLSIKLAFSIFFFVLAVIILGLTTLNPSKIEEKFFINRNQIGLFLPLFLILFSSPGIPPTLVVADERRGDDEVTP